MKKINIAVVGLGQIGNYLLHDLNSKKRDIELNNKLNSIKMNVYLCPCENRGRTKVRLFRRTF